MFPLLGLDHALILSAAPYIRRSKTGEGVQIDLLIQTKRSLFVVEVKRQSRIPYEVVAQVERKVKLMPIPADKSIRTVLVYAGEDWPLKDCDGFVNFKRTCRIVN